jgi:hypothetical protein
MEDASISGDLSLGQIYCSGKHSPVEFLKGVRSVTGATPLMGGSTLGVITGKHLGYSGYQAGAALISSDEIHFQCMCVEEISGDERLAGQLLGKQVAARQSDNDIGICLLYDSVKTTQPLCLNVASTILEGMESSMISPAPVLTGVGLIADYQFEKPCQFLNDRVLSDAAIALLISGKGTLHTSIMHGCQPSGSYKKITRIEGPVVYELDGRSALSVLEDMIGFREEDKKLWEDLSLLVTLGTNTGDKFGDYNEADYVSRLIVSIDREKGAIVLFEADFQEGTEVQIMRRSNDLMLESTRRNSQALVNRLASRKPVFAWYFDCAGRTSAFSGAESEEASLIQEIVGTKMPMLGIYSGVEIAPMAGKSRPLDWTGVLAILTENE